MRETSPRWLGPLPLLRGMEHHDRGCGGRTCQGIVCAQQRPGPGAGADHTETLQAENISTTEEKSRIITGISELDRVLGGGIVLGSVILIGGEPGIGKSTILLQLCGEVSKTRNVLYVTARNRSGRSNCAPCAWMCRRKTSPWWRRATWNEICGLIESMKPRPCRHRLHPDHALW